MLVLVWSALHAPGKDKEMIKPGKQMKPDQSSPAPSTTKPVAKLAEEIRPPRDPQPLTASIDRWVDAGLTRAGLAASPPAEDGEFLRRVTLDLIGRIPTHAEITSFLADTRPDKRALWVNALLASPAYGEHFGTIWRELISPRDVGAVKATRDTFTPWLADQLNANRGWDRIVTELLTVEGKFREQPQAAFILANSDSAEPQPNLLADATSRLFWGVQLRCAECHDHPFAPWTQADFWGTAAFFSRLRRGYTDGKNPVGWTFTEAAPDEPFVKSMMPKTWLPKDATGPVVLVPPATGKATGKIFPAKFLGGTETGWSDPGPYRPRFAAWAVDARNPWFAANTANRLWAHLFTRGLVMPLDGFHADNPPSHPELLATLARELTETRFDLKHLLRAITASHAYQRSSRPHAGNQHDTQWFSHRAVKVLRPEMLYASLSVALNPQAPKPGSKPAPMLVTGSVQPLPGLSRDEFIRFFSARPDENDGSLVNQGIPQFLHLMNGPLLRNTEAAAERFLKDDLSADQLTDALYLAAYARHPTAAERPLLKEYLAAQPDPLAAGAGLFWTLLNTAEFATNH